ncbi:hypothetical protein EYF80_048250 [Liparis tanakae]|uniref:Uncharacterized protein n=1 Tax=Liparis tanakae TaxID=230148 RepID=A0A4Z2FMQ9_9TELE|nr:hypothetical protein EYF80_048250 [Liparis tanakae]
MNRSNIDNQTSYLGLFSSSLKPGTHNATLTEWRSIIIIIIIIIAGTAALPKGTAAGGRGGAFETRRL